MKSKPTLTEQIREALTGHLEDIGFLVIGEVSDNPADPGSGGPDLAMEVRYPGGRCMLLVAIRNVGYPRTVREAANGLLLHMRDRAGSYGIVAAPFISDRSAQLLASEGIGYVDLAGNCRLEFGSVYIKVEGRKNPHPERRRLKSLFAPKASRIHHVLLLHPGKPWKIPEMAGEARVSVGEAHRVISALREMELGDRGKEGFALTQPGELLDRWSSDYNYRKNGVRGYYSMKAVERLEDELASLCRDTGRRFALAMFTGAERVAPFTRQSRFFAYVEGLDDELAASLDLKPVSSGANIVLMAPYDETVFYGCRMLEGIPVVSNIQLYLDLKSFRGRGEEAASFLREKEIEPSWRASDALTG